MFLLHLKKKKKEEEIISALAYVWPGGEEYLNKRKQREWESPDGYVIGVSTSSDNLAENIYITTDESASIWPRVSF